MRLNEVFLGPTIGLDETLLPKHCYPVKGISCSHFPEMEGRRSTKSSLSLICALVLEHIACSRGLRA